MPKLDVRLDGVTKSFHHKEGEVQALESIDLEVSSGSLVTIVGPSGCGKSTLLKIIARLVEPTSGTVYVDEKRVEGGIAYLPQSAALLPWRTARQNACISLEIQAEVKKGRSISMANLDHVNGMFREWRLSGFEDSYPNELSGGMAQRVALIRALIGHPKILLCDEPFSAIDFVTRLRLSTEFKKLCKVEAITTIVVTHNIEEAIFLGDQVIVMSGRPGRVVSTYNPVFLTDGHSAVSSRVSPEFGKLFESIWRDLEDHHT